MNELTGLPKKFLLQKALIREDKFYDWTKRYGKVNLHNGAIPRDHQLEDWEREKIKAYYQENVNDGYRRCCYKMIDEDVVYCSPSTVYRVLSKAGLLRRWNLTPSKKGTGFEQPLKPHEHWHTDISYIKIMGIYYYLVCILDGYSRFIIHWDIRVSMSDFDVGVVQQRAIEKFSGSRPRMITDNGKQFVGKEFKKFIELHDLTHVTTSVNYPQSNGKLERFHQSIKAECIRKGAILTLDDAKVLIAKYIQYYNEERLHSAIGYITPKDKLEGRAEIILKQRDLKLEKRRTERELIRKTAKTNIFVLDKKEITIEQNECQA
jgi:putative transposase